MLRVPQVLLVQQDHKDYKVLQEALALLEPQDQLALLEAQDHKDQQVLQEQLEAQDHRVAQEVQEQPV